MVMSIHVGLSVYYVCEDKSRSNINYLSADCENEDIWEIASLINTLQLSPIQNATRTDTYKLLEIE